MACAVHNTPSTNFQDLSFECSAKKINAPVSRGNDSLILLDDKLDACKAPKKTISDYIVTAARNVAI